MQILGHDISPIQLGGIAILAYLGITQGSGNLASYQQQSQLIAQQRQGSQLKTAQLQASEQEAKALEKIANDRYDRGCEMVFAPDKSGKITDRTTSITEGSPVIDSSRKVPLSPGVIVCDRTGLTAKIISSPSGQPVAGELAFTSDRARISKAIARYRGATYQGSVN
jgi:hypothetical protein